MVSASILSVAALAAGSLVTAIVIPERSTGLTTSLKAVRNSHSALAVHARGLSRYGRAIPEGLANLVRRGNVDGK
jgi:hypothetical protein